MRTWNKGFSLIELMVIILIILTLLTLALPPMLGARTRAEVARVQQDIQVMESAIEWYYMDHKKYPESTLPTSLTNPQETQPPGLNRLMEPIRYIDRLPQDPFSDEPSASVQSTFQFGSGGSSTPGSKRIEAWILVSRGPDRILDTRHIDSFPMGTVTIEYNPTNGVKSSGDLVKYGGNYTQGNWFLNGKRISQNNQ